MLSRMIVPDQYRLPSVGELIRWIYGNEHAVLRDTQNDWET